jgi:hypothetical protein
MTPYLRGRTGEIGGEESRGGEIGERREKIAEEEEEEGRIEWEREGKREGRVFSIGNIDLY